MTRAYGLKTFLAGVVLFAIAAVHSAPAQAASSTELRKIQHIVVIYLENHSFDNLYGHFPRANGVSNAGNALIQVGSNGKPYAALPPVIDTSDNPPGVDERFPRNLRNGRNFPIDKYVPIDQKTGDIVHRFYQEQMQIDGGKMDKFVAISDAATLTMGIYDIRKTSLWGYARHYTLADNFFHAAFGGSFLNHFWLACACTPTFPKAPAAMVAQLDANGRMVKDGAVSPDGYAINTAYTVFNPHPASAKPEELLPPQMATTIGDQLSARNISWAWYSGGWDEALAGKPDPLFQFHHQVFAFFEQFGDGTDAKKEHLKDENEMLAAIARGELPAVTFWKPIGAENQHPGYAELVQGDRKVDNVIRQIQKSPMWKNTVIIVTYDENGGYWDHVAPPKIDKWGPGSRVPTIIVSPFAKRGFVDHTRYDTTSILKLIHERYALAPLSDREARVGDLTNALKLKM
jgi:phospholipase C